MAFQINQVVISGNLTRTPETRQTPSGASVTQLGLAYNERRKQGEEWIDVAHFFDAVVFGGQGEWLSRNAEKGTPLTVSGQLEQQTWEAKDGSGKRSKVSILARDVVLGQRAGGGPGQGGYQQQDAGYGQQQQPQQPQQGGYAQQAPQQVPAMAGPDEGDIPF